MKASGKFEIAVTSRIWCTSSLSLLPLPVFLSRSTRATTSWHNRNFKVSLVLKSNQNFLSPILLLPFLSLLATYFFTIAALVSSKRLHSTNVGGEKLRRVLRLYRKLNDKTSRLGWRRKICGGQKLHICYDFSTPVPSTNSTQARARD